MRYERPRRRAQLSRAVLARVKCASFPIKNFQRLLKEFQKLTFCNLQGSQFLIVFQVPNIFYLNIC